MAQKKKILIVDDELDLLLLVKGNLEDTHRFEVVTCDLPEEAENIVRKENPDLIMLDNIMPKRKGLEISESLKKSTEFRHIPIIMVSGRGEMVYLKKKQQFKWCPHSSNVQKRGHIVDSKDSEILSRAYQVDDYISKPFTTEVLLEVIDNVLKRFEKTEEDPSINR